MKVIALKSVITQHSNNLFPWFNERTQVKVLNWFLIQKIMMIVDDSFEEVRQQELDSKIYQNRVLLATSCTLPLDAPKNKGK